MAANGYEHKSIVDVNTTLYDEVTASRSANDEEKPKFFVGQQVKLLKDIVNDGTYPFCSIGTVMMPAGSIGYIRKIGEFLQVIRVYEVHFLGVNSALVEIVGCRENELFAMQKYEDEFEKEMQYLKRHREKFKKINKGE
ncbi:nitrogen fixation protein NifZ [Malaciobacter molluscorum LMG 25693]|uniref:Nitrogen fixation protein NifZ n=1 Tax=Malaciobacter molluscorum LMG 25693 TaxID=870501 RepID=A0AB33GVJ3_9BACT|nr:nitrogen fixation protein NifZ [Malaciobacter molluscorum]AXX93207.1 nitrogen fixation protein NifZ [Malaciobacter molluscorum LMG 25693]